MPPSRLSAAAFALMMYSMYFIGFFTTPFWAIVDGVRMRRWKPGKTRIRHAPSVR
jgi:hypothetical protein